MTDTVSPFKSKRMCRINEFAQLIGKLVAAQRIAATEYSWSHTKVLEREETFALIINNWNFNGKMVIPDYTISVLE